MRGASAPALQYPVSASQNDCLKARPMEPSMKILLAIDESEFSKAAADAIAAQFHPEETEVRVLHVVEPIAFTVPPQMAAGYYPELGQLMEEGRKLTEGAAQKLRAAGFKVSTLVEKGDTRSTIVDQAAAWPADLIVLGSQGRKGLNRFLLGSVSEAVARHAHCSVEIVRIPRRR
jgi:nucleotide-binding universal stress UspA family protein